MKLRAALATFSLLLTCLFLSARPCGAAESVTFAIAPAASWVREYPVPTASNAGPVSGGVAYLLVDQQQNVAPRSSYYHEARQILSDEGLQNGASINVSFDPEYEKLTFHHLRVTRGGVASERLDRSLIKLFQRERDLESFLYDGSFTAHCALDDVRIGDVIEYAYSIEGANPVMQDKYFGGGFLEWAIPVSRAVSRVVYPVERKLHFRLRNREIRPTITTHDGVSEWLWDERDVPARSIDPNTPRRYNPYGSFQVSEFPDWAAVVTWALPLYEVVAEPSAEQAAEVERLRAIQDPEERILAALRFVQEEVRYLGIESGVGSHRPTAPSEVMRRRFGDCKDKTLLLATLLRGAGVTATPALVHSIQREQVADRLPSPGSFNHVILHVENGGRVHWLDATRSAQRGPLSQIAISNFGKALLLRPGSADLVECVPPVESLPRKKMTERYRIGRPGEASRLEVSTEYRGSAAEEVRRFFQRTVADEIQKNYLRYYSRRFPAIQATGLAKIREIAAGSGCVVEETYSIPDIWTLDEAKKLYQVELSPSDLAMELDAPGATARKDPLAVNHPIEITQTIEAVMFEPWLVKSDRVDLSNAFFRYSSEAHGSRETVRLSYSYKSLVDQIAPAQVAAYDAALRKLENDIGYTFSYATPEQKLQAARDGGVQWSNALLLGLIGAAAMFAGYRFFKLSKLEVPLPPSSHRLDGIGGWLAFVALGHFVRPLVFIGSAVEVFPSIFNATTWSALTHAGSESYHQLWMPILLLEAIYTVVGFVFCVLLLFLFFGKRAAWPRCFIFFMALAIVVQLVDEALAGQITAVVASSPESSRELVKTIVGAAIWIPYCLVSKRVRATFRH